MRKTIFSIFMIAAVSAMAQVMPAPLKPGSKIAIITPASCIDSMTVVKGMEALRGWGYEPVPMNHVFGDANGSYTASDSARAADIMQAFADPSIDAIMCSRGGYGSTRLLPYIDIEVIRQNPKWLVGYSDITALHALMEKAGVMSIHGPMLGHLSEHPDDESALYLRRMLSEGLSFGYELPADSLNKPGVAVGKLVGGNFLVATGLAETPWDVLNIGDKEDVIIFLEDVGEKIYAIERVLLRLHQSGALRKVKGIIFGEYTNYDPDSDFETMEEMMRHWLQEYGYYDMPGFPIIYNFPTGHGDPNYPLPMGAKATLVSTPQFVTLTFE